MDKLALSWSFFVVLRRLIRFCSPLETPWYTKAIFVILPKAVDLCTTLPLFGVENDFGSLLV